MILSVQIETESEKGARERDMYSLNESILLGNQKRTSLVSFTEAKKLKMEEETNKIITN